MIVEVASLSTLTVWTEWSAVNLTLFGIWSFITYFVRRQGALTWGQVASGSAGNGASHDSIARDS